MSRLQGVSLAAELPEELLSAVGALRALAGKALKASQKAGVTPEAAAQHRRATFVSTTLHKDPPHAAECMSREGAS